MADKPFTIDAYPQFSRWTDNENRLHVILERRGTPERQGESWALNDRRIFLLDVHNEKLNEVPAENFETYVRTGLLKPVK